MQPEPDYHSLSTNWVSQSQLKTFIKSPVDYHWQYILGNSGWAGSAAATLGTLVHCLLLEPQLVEQQYYVYKEEERPEPDKTMASNLNKAWKASIERGAQEAGATIVSQAVYGTADAMLQVACAHNEAVTWLAEGHPHLVQHNELAIFWQNQVSELPLKSKLDRLLIDVEGAKAWVVDYKTTTASNKEEFKWSVKKYGYDIQAAFYEDAARAYLELNYPGITFEVTVLFIPQCTTAPYQVLGVLQLDQQTLSNARAKYERALQELEGCLHTGIWEQSNGIEVLQLSKPLEPLFTLEELIL